MTRWIDRTDSYMVKKNIKLLIPILNLNEVIAILKTIGERKRRFL